MSKKQKPKIFVADDQPINIKLLQRKPGWRLHGDFEASDLINPRLYGSHKPVPEWCLYFIHL